MRPLLPLALTVLMLSAGLTGCAPSSPLDSVQVEEATGQAQGRSVKFQTPVAVEEVSIRQLRAGTGAELDAGDAIVLKMDLFKGSDGTPIEAPFAGGPGQVIALDDQFKAQVPELHEALLQAQEGTMLAYSSPQTAGAAGDESTAVEIYEVAQKIPTTIEGKASPVPDGLPPITEDETGAPVLGPPQGQAPDELVAEYLIQGGGEPVQAGDTVIVHHLGMRWADAQVFDSSYQRGAPARFVLDNVIKGWQKGLVGKKTGSRVVLSVPVDQAYGTEAELGDDAPFPAGDLLFVIDILTTQPTPPVPTP
ncbi:MAG TPA: peptidylprolyl isomerase [Micrococcus luteus]|nr:peptidylprolyl isomerase [Micrococcus luteus]